MLNKGNGATRLARARHVLNVFQIEPETAALFGPPGDDPADTVLGEELYETALDTYYRRQLLASEVFEAVDHCTAAFQAARAAQFRITALARVMIKTQSDQDRLGIRGRRAEALGAWLVQANVFHINLNQEDRAQLRRVGVDEAELARAKGLLTALEAANAACVAAKAEAKAATVAKTEAFRALAEYMSRIITTARVLEPTDPDVALKLGMTADKRRKAKAAAEPVVEPEAESAEVLAELAALMEKKDTVSETARNGKPRKSRKATRRKRRSTSRRR